MTPQEAEDLATYAMRIMELEQQVRLFRDLLAVIHGDGGHHSEEVGLERSYQDAVRKIGEWKVG
jgi:hypothetical protein